MEHLTIINISAIKGTMGQRFFNNKERTEEMFEFFMAIGVIMTIVGVVLPIIAILDRNLEGTNHSGKTHSKFSVAHKAFIGIGLLLLVMGTSLTYLGLNVSTNNSFYTMYEKYQAANSGVLVMEGKQADLEVELQAFLDEYEEYEGGLITALQGRDSEDLVALFEAYPDLLASENVQQVMEQIVKLAEDIVEAKLGRWAERDGRYGPILIGGANQIALKYNSAAAVLPSRWFIPGDLPKKLPLYEIDGN